MIASLLQESNLSARQPRRASITLYTCFNQRRHLAKEGLVNFTEQQKPHHAPDVIHNSTTHKGVHGAEISIQISALAGLLNLEPLTSQSSTQPLDHGGSPAR